MARFDSDTSVYKKRGDNIAYWQEHGFGMESDAPLTDEQLLTHLYNEYQLGEEQRNVQSLLKHLYYMAYGQLNTRDTYVSSYERRVNDAQYIIEIAQGAREGIEPNGFDKMLTKIKEALTKW